MKIKMSILKFISWNLKEEYEKTFKIMKDYNSILQI